MKRFLNVFVLKTVILTSVILLMSCGGTVVDEKTEIAQQNIQQYFEEIARESFSGAAVIDGYKHSDLYILTPADESKIKEEPAPEGDEEKEFEHILHVADNFVGLALSGCNRSNIEKIIENDKNYRELNTGAKEYVMVSFVKIRSTNGEISKELGACFRLSSELNITNQYSVKEDDEDYVYTRLFGQSSGRFYGAVDCQYDYLERMYDYYVSCLNNDELSFVNKFVFLKELNSLFEYERFKYMDDRKACVENCLKQLDSYEDKKVLKDKAYAKIKTFKE
ncbi:MAG: hypothetical protein IJ431_08350 [Alistipes sp.]|nr:hypothetical protein [Alistipes sp.]